MGRPPSSTLGRWKCWTPWMTWAQGAAAACNGHRGGETVLLLGPHMISWWKDSGKMWESCWKSCWMWNLTVGWCEICDDFWVSGISRLIWQGSARFNPIQYLTAPLKMSLKSVKISKKKPWVSGRMCQRTSNSWHREYESKSKAPWIH